MQRHKTHNLLQSPGGPSLLRGSALSAPAGRSESPSISGEVLDPCIDASMQFAHGRDSGREPSVQSYKVQFVDDGRGSEIILRFVFL